MSVAEFAAKGARTLSETSKLFDDIVLSFLRTAYKNNQEGLKVIARLDGDGRIAHLAKLLEKEDLMNSFVNTLLKSLAEKNVITPNELNFITGKLGKKMPLAAESRLAEKIAALKASLAGPAKAAEGNAANVLKDITESFAFPVAGLGSNFKHQADLLWEEVKALVKRPGIVKGASAERVETAINSYFAKINNAIDKYSKEIGKLNAHPPRYDGGPMDGKVMEMVMRQREQEALNELRAEIDAALKGLGANIKTNNELYQQAERYAHHMRYSAEAECLNKEVSRYLGIYNKMVEKGGDISAEGRVTIFNKLRDIIRESDLYTQAATRLGKLHDTPVGRQLEKLMDDLDVQIKAAQKEAAAIRRGSAF